MLTTLKKMPADVVAITIDGKIDAANIDRMIALVDAKLAKHPVIHIFAEYGDFEWPGASALRHGVRKGWHLFSKLKRFGRVAIVSDKRWLRIAARIESALLPHVQYRTFTVAQRDQSLDWVRGKEMAAQTSQNVARPTS